MQDTKLNSLQESSKETSTDHTSCDLDVGGSARSIGRRGGGAGLFSTSAGRLVGLVRARGTSRAVRARTTSGLSAGGGRSVVGDGGGVVGADDDLSGRVVAKGNDNGVDARAHGRDADYGREGGSDRRDGSVNRRLVGLGASSRGLGGLNIRLASHDAEAVGLLEEGGLGESIDRGLFNVRECKQLELSRDKTYGGCLRGGRLILSESNSREGRDEEGSGAHFGC